MDNEPSPRPLSTIDKALLQAARAFGGDVDPAFWDRFRSDRQASLRWAWDDGEAGAPRDSLESLRHAHRDQARPDLSRVHVSWWLRALRDEPRSIQRAVAANLPDELSGAVRDGLRITAEELKPDRSGDPIALRFALHLWTVRFIGDEPDRADDPLVIATMTRLDSGTLAILIHLSGLAKWALASKVPPGMRDRDYDRLAWLRSELEDFDPRFIHVAERDIAAMEPHTQLPILRLGFTTFARLLNLAEPYRARWALQHIPYATARTLRSMMGPEGGKTPILARWEGEILRLARQRLEHEGLLVQAPVENDS